MCSSADWWSGIQHIVFGVSMVELKSLVPDSMTEPIGSIESLNIGLAGEISVTSGIKRTEVLALWGVNE